MRIVEIESRNRRDFYAIYECEHCGTRTTGSGYDDEYFHKNVIPNIVCKACGKKSPSSYEPRATKYSEDTVV